MSAQAGFSRGFAGGNGSESSTERSGRRPPLPPRPPRLSLKLRPSRERDESPRFSSKRRSVFGWLGRELSPRRGRSSERTTFLGGFFDADFSFFAAIFWEGDFLRIFPMDNIFLIRFMKVSKKSELAADFKPFFPRRLQPNLKIVDTLSLSFTIFFMKKNFFAAILFSLIALVCASSYAQEIPQDIKDKIRAKSAELNPGNESAAKAWTRQQIESWETIQNMTFSIDPDELDAIKAAAQKKFPYEYVKQEAYIGEQAKLASSISEFKTMLGKDDYKAIRKALEASGKTDLTEITELLRKQSAAKIELQNLNAGAMDPTTFAIAKEVIKKQFPTDYVAQLAALKKQMHIADSPNAAAPDGAIVGIGADAAAAKVLTVNEKLAEARKVFQSETLLVSGAAKGVALAIQMTGKQVLLVPFSCYSADMTIANNLGEKISLDVENAFASKELPLIILFPKELPSDTRNAEFATEKDFKEAIGKQMFVIGYNGNNVNSIPVKISSVSSGYITLSSKIPSGYSEGSTLMNADNYCVMGMIISEKEPLGSVNWSDKQDINKVIRILDRNKEIFSCARLDKFKGWEKISQEKLAQQRKMLEKLTSVNKEVMNLITQKRLAEFTNSPILGSISKKYMQEFRSRMDPSRFSRLYRGFAGEIHDLIRNEAREFRPQEFYTLLRGDAERQFTIANGLMGAYAKASKSISEDLMPQEIKNSQEKK